MTVLNLFFTWESTCRNCHLWNPKPADVNNTDSVDNYPTFRMSLPKYALV